MFYLTTHSTHFIYGYMASDIWLRTTQIAREETRCRHMGYFFRLAARVLLYAKSHYFNIILFACHVYKSQTELHFNMLRVIHIFKCYIELYLGNS